MKRLICALIALHSLSAQAEWGRLFFTPQQRSTPPQTPASAPAPAVHQFSGEVRSSNGQSLRWIDGQLSAHKLPKGIKPGQSWDAHKGTIYPYPPNEHDH